MVSRAETSRREVAVVLGALGVLAVNAVFGCAGCVGYGAPFGPVRIGGGRLPSGPGRREPGPWDVPPGVDAREWRHVVIHHSGTDEGSAAAFDRYHREVRGWEELGYHFVIGNGRGAPDGVVEVGARWRGQRAGAHARVRGYNELGIGICLVGNFETSAPTKRQLEALGKLLAFLTGRFGIPAAEVVRHSDLAQTKCPGRFFPWPVTR